MPSDSDLATIKQLLDSAENNIRQAKNILFQKELLKSASVLGVGASEANIIEGVFDGEKMIASSGKHYQVPANYASKSKLVCGDLLKLTILDDGTFLYKQIGPIKRKKLTGVLEKVSEGKYVVICKDSEFQVLPASVTYFKASHGDTLSILVPSETPTEWAAVENLIEK